jgi:hypothetical protein
VILVRGDLASLSIPTGSLYNDIRVGGGITAGITVGGAIVKHDNNQVYNGSIIAVGAIKAVAVTGDFDGDIISHTGGITSVLITNGSFLPGNTIAAYDGSIGSAIATRALEMLKVDEHGFDSSDRRLLLTLMEKFDGGPVGVDSLAAALSEDRDTIEDVLEPYLIQQGFLMRTPRGRMATAKSYRHFGLQQPAQLASRIAAQAAASATQDGPGQRGVTLDLPLEGKGDDA